MGAMNGFDVLQRVRDAPLVIFTTAYDQYALQAFATNSVDYLLKPIDPRRLAKAVAKLSHVVGREAFQQALARLGAMFHPLDAARVPVKLGDRIKLVDPADILFFRAGEKYVELVTREHR